MRFPSLYRWSLRAPKTILLLSLSFTLLSIWAASHLRIENNLIALLPQKFESVQALKKMEKSFGGLGYLVVTVQDTDEVKAKAIADQLATQIEKLPGVQYVDYHRPVDFFKKRQWLYLETEDLQEMERRLDRSLVLQEKGVSPVFNDLVDFADEENRPDLTFKDIREKYRNQFSLSEETSEDTAEVPTFDLKVKLRTAQQNLDLSQDIIIQIQKIAGQVKNQLGFNSVQVRYTGDHVQAMETVEFLRHRMALVSTIVMVLIFGLLWLYFRRFRWVLLVGLPLGMGILWTGGIIYLLFHHLNILTGFAAGILGGLGSDYGIYLLGRFLQERRRGLRFEEACHKAFGNTGTATFASMLTTVISFLALMFSDFKVSMEFGIVGALGLILNYFAMMLVIPAALKVGRSVFQNDEEKTSYLDSSTGPWASRLVKIFYPRAAGVGLGLALLLCLVAGFTLRTQSKLQFEDGRMDALGLPSDVLYQQVAKRSGGTLQPTVLLTESAAEADKILQAFLSEINKSGKGQGFFKQAVGLNRFIPQQVEAKREILKRLHEKFQRSHFPVKDIREQLIKDFSESLIAPIIGPEDLPQEVLRLFQSSISPSVFAVYLFPQYKDLNWEWMEAYSQKVYDVRSQYGLKFLAADNPFVAFEFVQMMRREAPKMLLATLVFLLIVTVAMVRPLPVAMVIYGHLIVALILLSGLMWLLKLPLNTLNIAALPIILGTGVDCFIHFALRIRELGDLNLAIRDKFPSIFISNFSSILGFGALLFVPSSGIRSLGMVAMLGMVLMTVLCVWVFPRSLKVIHEWGSSRLGMTLEVAKS